jgi:hypothetical protein
MVLTIIFKNLYSFSFAKLLNTGFPKFTFFSFSSPFPLPLLNFLLLLGLILGEEGTNHGAPSLKIFK